jgi:hypothetical protein
MILFSYDMVTRNEVKETKTTCAEEKKKRARGALGQVDRVVATFFSFVLFHSPQTTLMRPINNAFAKCLLAAVLLATTAQAYLFQNKGY